MSSEDNVFHLYYMKKNHLTLELCVTCNRCNRTYQLLCLYSKNKWPEDDLISLSGCTGNMKKFVISSKISWHFPAIFT